MLLMKNISSLSLKLVRVDDVIIRITRVHCHSLLNRKTKCYFCVHSFVVQDVYILTNGYHELKGSKIPLKKPLLVGVEESQAYGWRKLRPGRVTRCWNH